MTTPLPSPRLRPAAALVAAALALILVFPATSSALVRREGRYFTYYVPTAAWVAAESAQGIDLSSPTGTLYVGHGFATSLPGPVTHQEVVDYVVRTRALDVHPLSGVRFTGRSGVARSGGIARRVYRWTARRTDRRQTVKGVLTVEVYADDSTGAYGMATYSRVGPARTFARDDRTLAAVQRLIFYHPHTPDIAPVDGPFS